METEAFLIQLHSLTSIFLNQCVTKCCSLFFFYPAFTTLYEFETPHSRGYEITHKDAPHSVGLLWTSDRPVQRSPTD